MADPSFLQQSKLNSTSLFQHAFISPQPINFSCTHNNPLKINHPPFSKLGIKCFTPKLNFKPETSFNGNSCEQDKELKPISTINGSIKGFFKCLKITGVLLGLLLLYDRHHVALAASGGQMGGGFFSSLSAPSSWGPELLLGGGAVGFLMGGGYNATTALGGPSVGVVSNVFYVMTALSACILLSALLSYWSNDGHGRVLTASGKTSVLKLQVGLLGMGKTLQRDLNRIAEAADTSTPNGLRSVLQETALALLRHSDYCIYGYSSAELKKTVEEGEKRFYQLSIEERGKFDEETLVNINNIRKKVATSQSSNGLRNEYIVVTIIVVAGDVHKLPLINGSAQLNEALQKLASIPSSRIMAVEVLWTPQNENDTLSERELLEDYPLLRLL